MVNLQERFPLQKNQPLWPMVSRPVHLGGLGFSMKWNMGWMNDTLRYISQDPIHRAYYHDLLTFSQVYAYTENFVLPLSHDEIVHGKKSLIDKMPGDVWQRFANVRLLFFYQMTHPGKKLNFMGNEFAHGREWNVHHPLDWDLLDIDWHEGIARLFADLTRLYVNDPVLHHFDFSQEGLNGLIATMRNNRLSVISEKIKMDVSWSSFKFHSCDTIQLSHWRTATRVL